MSETSALRPGQKVTLSGTVESIPGPCNEGCAYVLIDGDYDGSSVRSFPYAALTPVVEPEPVWQPGDVVRIDGMNYFCTDGADSPDLMWYAALRTRVSILPNRFSTLWAEGRVEVIYRKEADK